MFSVQSVSLNLLVATFQLSSGASLNFERSKNGVLGNGLNKMSYRQRLVPMKQLQLTDIQYENQTIVQCFVIRNYRPVYYPLPDDPEIYIFTISSRKPLENAMGKGKRKYLYPYNNYYLFSKIIPVISTIFYFLSMLLIWTSGFFFAVW